MKKNNHIYSIRWAYGTLWLCAFIWGVAYVFQKIGMRYIEPMQFVALRCLLSTLALLPVLIISSIQDEYDFDFIRMDEVKYGLLYGVLLWLGFSLQQHGLVESTASVSAGISVMYIVFVPIMMRLFLKEKILLWHVALMVLGLVGFALITRQDNRWGVSRGDFILFISTFVWAVHVPFLAYFRGRVRVLPAAFMQMLVCTILSFMTSFALNEQWIGSGIVSSIPALIFTGIVSGGLAFTLQIYGQKVVNPILSGVILSAQAIFAVWAGWFFLGEELSIYNYLGGLLIMLAIILFEVLSHWYPRKVKQSAA